MERLYGPLAFWGELFAVHVQRQALLQMQGASGVHFMRTGRTDNCTNFAKVSIMTSGVGRIATR
jgi:hypothetical protein